MLENRENKIDETKESRKFKRKSLEYRIGELQRKIKELKIPVMVIFDGWNSAGKGKVINDLMTSLDPRNFIVYNETRQTHEIRNRTLLYYYWTRTPRNGEFVTFDSSYYAQVYKRSKKDDIPVETLIKQINQFESAMRADGMVIVKFFLNISQKTQKKRLKALSEDPIASWQATEEDWKENENYDKIAAQWDYMISETDSDEIPWHVVNSKNLKDASYKVIDTLVDTLEKAVEEKKSAVKPKLVPLIKADDDETKNSPLNNQNPEDVIPKSLYKPVIKEYQAEIRELEYMIFRKRIPVMIAFEGFDAAGKGGAIKRVAKNLDPRGYRVYPSSAPNDVEREHDWLWRYWNTIPKRGHFSIYDRTWYGRVLVEPIEGFLTKDEYERAFPEIRDFEKQLTDFGTVILKFWMNISDEEQLARFKAREDNPEKQWKITEEDWRNRDKRTEYVLAADRMFEETSTKNAPWIIVNGDDKRYARVKVLNEIIRALRKAL